MLHVLAVFAFLMSTHPPTGWDTAYEKSDFRRSPTYAETVDYCRRLADESPWVHFANYGTSARGRPLPLLVIDRRGRFSPESVRSSGNVVFLIQAGIHAGEIDGKDAGLMLARDIAVTRRLEHLADHVTILFIPIFNVDGHERRGPYNRPNQNGPQEMGWRTTANNLNLNRDYLKADTPEMRAWLRLYTAWLPEFFADCHVTDGADYQYAVTYAVEIFGNMDVGLTRWARERYLEPLKSRMQEAGVPIVRYPWFRRGHDPQSGLMSWAALPRFSQGYTALQNRPGVLIEAHSLKDYHTRVDATYKMLVETLELLNAEHERLRALVRAADARTASPEFRGERFPLAFETSQDDSVMVKFLGVDYDVVQSKITGGAWYRFSDRPVTFDVPYFNVQIATETVDLPEAYVIPPEWSDVIARLELHGVTVERTQHAASMRVASYRFVGAKWSEEPYEGRHRATFEAVPIVEERVFPEGSVVVDMNQRAARVAAQILEPQGPDSYASWGFFDAIFERKEYIESYVAEKLAREMIDADSTVSHAFDAWMVQHTDATPDAIREWFYRRSPYWDSHINVYPVGRIMDRGDLDALRAH